MKVAIGRSILVLTALLSAASCSSYLGEPQVPRTSFRADLYGANEVPPTESRGRGYFEAVYRPSTKVLEYRLNLVGLSGPVTMGYLHGPARPSEIAERVAPINIPFYDYDSAIWNGVTLTEQQAAELLAGRWYVSVRTVQYPDGEIRGQILPVGK